MHDCGKLSTPDSILEKPTKLHGLRDGIDRVVARMDAIGEQWKADFYRQVAHGEASLGEEQTLRERLEQLESDKAFLSQANKGGEFMCEQHKDRVKAIAQ